MKLIKFLLFYLLSFFIFILTAFIVSGGSLLKSLEIYVINSILFNAVFISLFYIIFKRVNKKIIISLTFLALLLLFIISEFIYPVMLKDNFYISEKLESEPKSYIKAENNIDITPIFNSYLDRAEYYYNKSEFSSAWIYADIYRDNGGKNRVRAEYIMDKSLEALNKNDESKIDNKYLDNLYYNNLIKQNKIDEAYYYLLDNIDNNSYDFLIKFKSSYRRMLEKYYSINSIESFLDNPGYTDISFYSIKNGIKKYSVERIVELNGEYYFKNLNIDGINYPYLYINSDGEIFSNGFREDIRHLVVRNTPYIPVEYKDLKLFSKEYYPLSFISLSNIIKVYNYSVIRYLKVSHIESLIMEKIIDYLTVFIMFLAGAFFLKKINLFEYGFRFGISLYILMWFINKTGLILSSIGLSLSVIVICVLYALLFIFLYRRSKLLLSQS